MPPPHTWYQGAPLSTAAIALDPRDPALLYGATVFTTLRVYGQDLHHPRTAWVAHRDRLGHSLQALDWLSPDWVGVEQGATLLAPHWPVLRVTLFPDGRELIIGRVLPPDLAQWQCRGITAWVAPPDYGRPLPGHKTGNYLGCWLARHQAQGQGAQEAILTNAQGHWLETATGNLWGWGAGQWWTPPLGAGILPGIGRSRLLATLQAQGQPVNQLPWTEAVRSRLTHLAYSNSVVGIVPIQRVLHSPEPVNYNPDQAVIQILAQAFQGVPLES